MPLNLSPEVLAQLKQALTGSGLSASSTLNQLGQSQSVREGQRGAVSSQAPQSAAGFTPQATQPIAGASTAPGNPQGRLTELGQPLALAENPLTLDRIQTSPSNGVGRPVNLNGNGRLAQAFAQRLGTPTAKPVQAVGPADVPPGLKVPSIRSTGQAAQKPTGIIARNIGA